MDGYILNDKARRADALREAQSRGLDADELRRAVTSSVIKGRSSRRRMNPNRHAAALLRETTLSFREIASITGLDIYAVVGLKLKLRATNRPRPPPLSLTQLHQATVAAHSPKIADFFRRR
jgi:hypothetical protein